MRAPPVTSAEAAEGVRPSRLLQRASLLLALGVAAVAFAAAFYGLGPDSTLLPPFNSDSAVPVLMSNQRHWDLFAAYYWGQDRFGAWPFFLAHGLSVLLGRPATPESLHALSTAFLLLGALPAGLLARPFSGLGVLAYTVAILVPESRGSLFEVAQLYPWQLPLLFWAWWCLREAWQAAGLRPRLRWLGLAGLLCFFATWTSTLSGPLLLGVTVLEGLLTQPQQEGRGRWLLLLLPSLLGMALEAAMRADYHRFVRAAFGRDFRTGLRLDWGYFQENFRQVWAGLWSPLVVAALALLSAYSVLWFLKGRRGKRAPPCASGLQRTVLGAFLLGLLPLPVLGLVRHIRLNDFAPRYFAPSYVFLLYGGLLAVASFWPERRPGRQGQLAQLVGTAALAALALAFLPRGGKNPDYARMRLVAQSLAARAPGALLLDGYWGTYVFAALAPPSAIVPLPAEGEWNRVPATESKLPSSQTVVVGHRNLLSPEDGTAPRWLFQYGTLLERTEPRFLSDGVDSFSTYRPRAVAARPYLAEPSLEGLDLAAGEREVTVHTEVPPGDWVLAVGLGCPAASPSPSGFLEDSTGRRLLEVEREPGVALFSFKVGRPGPLTLHLHFGAETCRTRGARIFARPA